MLTEETAQDENLDPNFDNNAYFGVVFQGEPKILQYAIKFRVYCMKN